MKVRLISDSFIKGMARALDLFGTGKYSYNIKQNKQTDSEAIASDWQAVGNDLKKVMGNYEGKDL